MFFHVRIDNSDKIPFWINIPINKRFNYNQDILFSLKYTVLANDITVGATIRLQADVYKTIDGEIEGAVPDYQAYDDITPSNTGLNKLTNVQTVNFKIPGGFVSNDDPMIAIRLWRDTSIGNNYDAEFVLTTFIPKQVV